MESAKNPISGEISTNTRRVRLAKGSAPFLKKAQGKIEHLSQFFNIIIMTFQPAIGGTVQKPVA